ncbi:MAG TPA: amidase family protein [Bacteroidia bacterium]|nr:amidase family protein [Bacteroidia bacterium]
MKKHFSSLVCFIFFCSLCTTFPSCKPKASEESGLTADSTISVDLEEITIPDLQEGYKQGKYTITAVVQNYLNRIHELDKDGPQLNSVIEINPDALAIAAELDKEFSAGKSRGPLHGIPVLLKDNIDTHDQMHTTAGATVLKNSTPQQDSWGPWPGRPPG